MKPSDLDDRAPLEPDDELLARVHARSQSFRRRRKRLRSATSVTSGLIVLALAGGIAWIRLDATNGRGIRPAPSATTTTLPTITEAALAGEWRPVSISGHDGPLTKPPLYWVPRLTFNGRGQWGGSDGCNDHSGTYRIERDGTLHFLTFQQTLVGCGPDIPDFEPVLSAARIELQGARLTFRAADGAAIAQFARSGVATRIELPARTMSAGSTMSGHVVVENNTGHPLHATGCGHLFQVILGNDQVGQVPVWRRCLETFTIPAGTSTYPVTVRASYVSCYATGQNGTTTTCLPTGGPPPLPPGDYRAIALRSDNTIPIPLPIDVRVEPQRSAR